MSSVLSDNDVPSFGRGGSTATTISGRAHGPSPRRWRISDILDSLRSDDRFVHLHEQKARTGESGELSKALDPEILRRVPYSRLWSHQAEAINLARDGRSVAVATGTGSGKSLCYQIPVAEAVTNGGTALMVFPTKALAQDQLLAITRLGIPGMVCATYDGDCTPEERAWVRSNANVILTNPEMLHNSILPNRHQWTRLLQPLRFVVVDELHVLRGVFGSNVAHVLRRLRRSVQHCGGIDPTFIFTSATIGRPQELAAALSGLPVSVVDRDGSTRGTRHIVVWNPANVCEGSYWSPTAEAAMMACKLIRSGLRTLVFCPSRRATEVVTNQIRSNLEGIGEAVRSYRGGYLRSERREIEHALLDGQLMGIVATNTLELGVDISGLDAVVLSGYPGTISSFHQQLGRSGREGEESMAILITGENQLDQWMAAHPDELFERRTEPAAVSLDNPFIYVPHLGCAAHERPLVPADSDYWPSQIDEGVRQLVLSDRARLRRSRGQLSACWEGRGSPARTISLRSAGLGEFRITDSSDHMIGTVPEGTLYSAAHVGAIYLHQGVAWRVTDIDPDRRQVKVVPDPGDTYTLARTSKAVSIRSTSQVSPRDGWTLSIGTVEVSTQVTGYQVRSTATHEVVARESIDVPGTSLVTRAVWYAFDDDLVERAMADAGDLAGSLHGLEHAAIGILPLFAICDRWDVGGLSTEFMVETGSPTVVIHDAYPGGAGIAEMAYDATSRHLATTLDLLMQCSCPDGCPRCVQSPKCGNGNEPLTRVGAARLLSAALGKDPRLIRGSLADDPAGVGF